MNTDNATAQTTATTTDTAPQSTAPVETTETTQQLDSTAQPTDTQQEESTESTEEVKEPGSESPEAKAPFASATEKFVVNGKTYEWDWPTTKKMAQLGFAGRKAMQEKAELQKSHKAFLNEVYRLAAHDPETLIETFGGKRGQQKASQNPEQSQELTQQLSPEVESLKRELQELKQDREQRLIAEEAQKIKQEWDTATEQYPELKEPVLGKLLFTQAKQLQYQQLEAGVENYTLEDAAFDVVQFYRSENQKAAAQKKQNLAAKQAKAPAVSKQGSVGTEAPKKFNTFEDVKKQFGISF